MDYTKEDLLSLLILKNTTYGGSDTNKFNWDIMKRAIYRRTNLQIFDYSFQNLTALLIMNQTLRKWTRNAISNIRKQKTR
jgi:hypothetical protein